MNPAEVLRELQNISSSTAKVKFLKKHDSELLRNIINHAVNPYITFGIKQYEFSAEPALHDGFLHDLKWMDKVITELAKRGYTGNVAQQMIRKASDHLNEDQRYVLACMLDKDLKCGVSAKTANKAFPGMIPLWAMQKAQGIKMDKIIYPCIAEIKENGRGNNAIIINQDVEHKSNNGKVWEPGAYFDEELVKIADGMPMVIFGEVRGRHGKGVDQYQASQTFTGKDPDMTDAVFVIWDMLLLGEFKRQKVGDNRTMAIRSRRLKDHLRQYQFRNDKEEYKVKFVKQKLINSEEELLKYYEKMLAQGHEGLIVKNMNSTYEFKCSYNWMKLKPMETIDLKIVGVKEGKGKLKGTLGSVVVRNGKTKVDCPMGKGITHTIAKEMWEAYKKDKTSIIGHIGEVQYQNETADGSLFLPKFLCIRDDKDVSDSPKPKKKKSKKSKK